MMQTLRRNLYFVLLIAASAVAQPNITGLSVSTAARSNRALLQGFGFGAMQGGGHVDIGGIVAPLTRWSDTLIAAYVPPMAARALVAESRRHPKWGRGSCSQTFLIDSRPEVGNKK